MEEKILKEFENINVQLKEMNQGFDVINQRFDKILNELEEYKRRTKRGIETFEKILAC